MPAAVIAAVATPFVALLGEGGAIAFATFAVNSTATLAATTAINRVAGALTGKSKTAIQQRQASVTSLSLGEVPREAVIGVSCVGGSLVDVWNWGGQYSTDNVTRCVALADHAVESLYGYFVDDVFYLYTGPGVQPGFGGTLTIDFRNATADGHAPPSYAAAQGWEPGDRMTAVTHAWVTTKFDEKVWTQGHPKFRWVLHGLRAFDPRNGDVWEDRATHSFTRNPTLLRYALARGIYAEGHQGEPDHLLIGRGLSAEEAPPERLIAAANLCDESVDGLSRYYTDGVISADMDFITVEQMFADAMAGSIVQHEGGVEVEPGQAKAAVVTITDGDLVVGEPVGFSHFLPDSDGGRINTVIPRYVSPAQGYVDHSGPVRRDLADIAEDGGPREMTLAMPLVSGAAVADRNAEITRLLARLERRATIVLPPEFAWLEEGDWIAWQSNRRHDGATVRYRIESWSLDAAWRMRLSLREIASSVYGVPDPIEDLAEPPPPPVPVDALALSGVSAEAITLPGETSVMPAIRMRWDTPVDAATRAIRAEVRTVGGTDAAPTRTEDVASGVMVVTNGVGASQTLQARLVPIGEPTRPVLPSVWFTVTTGSLVAGDLGSAARASLLDQLRATLSESSEAEALAEVLLETILNEHEGLVSEARQRVADVRAEREARGENIAEVRQDVTIVRDGMVASVTRIDQDIAATALGVALAEQRSRVYADGVYSQVEASFTTTAAFGAGLASTLSSSQSYTDAFEARAGQTFATTAALGTGLAGTLIQSQAQVDAYAASAALTFATIASLNGSTAAVLQQANAYSDGVKAYTDLTFYSRAAVELGLSNTLQQATTYADQQMAQASLTFATSAQFNSVSASAALALSTAVDAQGKANSQVTIVQDVDGYISGVRSENNGTSSAFFILADAFAIVAPGGGASTQYLAGNWYAFNDDGSVRSVWGKPFGILNQGLAWWTGPNSVPIGSESKTNAYVYIATNTVGGGRFGGSDVGGGTAPLGVDAPYRTAQATTSPGGGSASTSTITITPQGNGAAGAQCRWVKASGDDRIQINANGFSAAFSADNVPAGGFLQATFFAVVFSGNQSVTVVVDVQIFDPN